MNMLIETNMGVGGGHIIVSSMAVASLIYDNFFLENYFESFLTTLLRYIFLNKFR